MYLAIKNLPANLLKNAVKRHFFLYNAVFFPLNAQFKPCETTFFGLIPPLTSFLAPFDATFANSVLTEPELAKYKQFSEYVLSVKPGLSGMWQISGRSNTGYEERINLDTYYIQNWSIWLDLWIIIKTVGVVIIGKGAF